MRSAKKSDEDLVVNVKVESVGGYGYCRVQWGRQNFRVPVASVGHDVAVAKDIAMKLKAMVKRRGPGRTEKSQVEAYRDELIADAVAGRQEQEEEEEDAAGNEATAGQLLS